MATKRWVGGRAKSTAQAGTITIGVYDAATTYSVGIPNTTSGKVVSTPGTGGSAVATAAALAALLNACLEPEFLEISWATPTTAVISYAVQATLAGLPVTVAVAATGGTGTITTATTTANSSPNDLNASQNWDGNVLPTNNDTLIYDVGGVSALWNLDAFAALTGLTVIRRRDYTGYVALPEYNSSGYLEYRATEFQTAGGTFNFEQRQDDAVAQFKFNGNAAAMTFNGVGEGPGTLRSEQCWVRGTNAANAFNFEQMTAAVAVVDNQAATVATLKCQNSTVRCGQGVTFGTSILSTDTELEVNSNLPTPFTQLGAGAATWVKGAATGSSPAVQDGIMHWMSTGTLTTPTVGSDATMNFGLDNHTRTIAGNVQMYKGANWNDPSSTTVPVTLIANGCRPDEINYTFGPGRTIAVS